MSFSSSRGCKASVIFKNNFIYDWHIGTSDDLDYYLRPEAQQNSETLNRTLLNLHSAKYDFITYMMLDKEKSKGGFDSEKLDLSDDDIKKYRDMEKASQSNGCPKYIQVISFDNNFLVENGLMVNGELDSNRLKKITQNAMAKFIQKEHKLEVDNVYWYGGIHYNTDNIHVHISLLEKERRVDRLKHYKDKDMLSVKSFDTLKSSIISQIVGKNEHTNEITRLQRDIITPKFRELTRNEEVRKQMRELLEILPETEKAWQYGRKSMLPYRDKINAITYNILNCDKLKNTMSEYNTHLDTNTELFRNFYGSGERHKYLDYRKNKQDELYKMCGNALLQSLYSIKQEIVDDEQEEKDEDFYIVTDFELLEKHSKPISKNEVLFEKSKAHIYSSYHQAKDILREIKQKEYEIFHHENGKNPTKKEIEVFKIEQENKLKKAEQLLIEADDGTIKYTKYFLGKIYLTNPELFPDKIDKGISYLSEFDYETVTSFARYTLAKFYINNGDKDNGERYLSESANLGNKYAQYMLAKAYLSEKRKTDVAMELLNKSAEQDYIHAQYKLGKLLLDTDEEQAEKWFRKSAEKGYKYSQYQLGKMYIKNNPDEAKKWLELSAKQNCQCAIALLDYLENYDKMSEKKTKRKKIHKEYNRSFLRSGFNTNYALNRLINQMESHTRQLISQFEYEEAIRNGNYDMIQNYRYKY